MKKNTAQTIQFINEHIRNGQKVFIMTCGLPGSGKSTFLKKLQEVYKDFTIASTDNIVERESKNMGLTYSEGFHQINFKHVNAEFKTVIQQSVDAGSNLAIDQTNVTSKSRKSKVEMIPNEYIKICLVFDVSTKELVERLAKRAKETGKYIPANVISSMTATWQTPSKSDGFDYIVDVQQ